MRQVAVGRQGVDARQLQQLLDALLPEKSLQRRRTHLCRGAVAQVLVDQEGDAFGDGVAPAQPAADVDGHLRSKHGGFATS